MSDEAPPSEFICPITLDVMQDPVMAADGHNYDRTSIKRAFEANMRSPKTNEPLSSREVFPNHDLRSRIMEWREKTNRGKKRPSADTICKELEDMVQSICFMQNGCERKSALELLMTKMKEHEIPLSEFYVNRLVQNYDGSQSEMDAFLETNRMLEDRAKKRMRVADAVVAYSVIRDERLGKQASDTQLKMDKYEEELEKLRHKMRAVKERLESSHRVRDAYADSYEEARTNRKKRKLSTMNTDSSHADDEDKDGDDETAEKSHTLLETARDMILEAMEHFVLDEWRYIHLMQASWHLGHPLATLISEVSGWSNTKEDSMLRLEAYARDTSDKDLALVAKHHFASKKIKDATDAEHAEAIAMLIENAEAGYTHSMISLATTCRSIDDKKLWAKKAWDAGHVAGGMCMALACHTTENLAPLLQDVELGRRVKSWMKASAEAGVTRAQYWFGRYVEIEIGDEDIEDGDSWVFKGTAKCLARRMFKLAAEKGHSVAMHDYGRYILGDAKKEKDPKTSVSLVEEGYRWIQRSADCGCKFAKDYISRNCKISMHPVLYRTV